MSPPSSKEMPAPATIPIPNTKAQAMRKASRRLPAATHSPFREVEEPFFFMRPGASAAVPPHSMGCGPHNSAGAEPAPGG